MERKDNEEFYIMEKCKKNNLKLKFVNNSFFAGGENSNNNDTVLDVKIYI